MDDVSPNEDEQDREDRRVTQKCRVDIIQRVRREARKEIEYSVEATSRFETVDNQ